MTDQILKSWGRIQHANQEVVSIDSRNELLIPKIPVSKTWLPYGNGRSYGDSCLNSGGVALKTGKLNRFISFDPSNGILICEAGVLLSEILNLIVPQGWFLPVTPGTRFVTVGGAIANDVHGKNHHVTGTFGSCIRSFELQRSDSQRLICSEQQNSDFFAASIGGLGLTGIIIWAEIQLRRIRSPWIEFESIRYESLAEFFDLCEESDKDYEYTVSWVDCAGTGKRLGRGLFVRGNHAPIGQGQAQYHPKIRTFPFVPPISMINSITLKAFNALYYRKQIAKKIRSIQHYQPFFYPLDEVLEWNRMYGPKGFYQYQCVVPTHVSKEATTELLKEIAKSGMGSFLAVLKLCGNKSSPGMLSFPLPGVSLALDFPNRGQVLHHFFIGWIQSLQQVMAVCIRQKMAECQEACFDKVIAVGRNLPIL